MTGWLEIVDQIPKKMMPEKLAVRLDLVDSIRSILGATASLAFVFHEGHRVGAVP
jgi:hypothetical protein